MSERSKISWCDATWNPTQGCTKVSQGCAHCYAERWSKRFRKSFDLRLVPKALDLPLHWKKPRRIFVDSMSDLFHPEVPDSFVAAVFGVMAECPQHRFLVLTKRPERMKKWFAPTIHWPLPNVWLGVSVENQETADERIPILLDTPAAHRFVSAEPLLGSIDFSKIGQHRTDNGLGMESWEKLDALNGSRFTQTWGGPWIWNGLRGPKIDWCIVSGESGLGSRPCDVRWIRSIVQQCESAKVPCFTKQLGTVPLERVALLDSAGWGDTGIEDAMKAPLPPKDWTRIVTKGKAWLQRNWHLCNRKGSDPSEWSEDIRVQQLPEGLCPAK